VPLRPCLTCGELSRGSYCERHTPPPWRGYRSPGRGSRTDAQRFRTAVLAKTGGRCAICGSTDRVVAHHVIGLAEGGSNDPEANGLALCEAHHDELERRRRALR
jgi:5-methylcytosine-specific restriction endonuclease McrA